MVPPPDLVRRNEVLKAGLIPNYLRYNLWHSFWDGSDASPSLPLTVADWSEHAPPLNAPPSSEYADPLVQGTLSKYSYLFKVVTPINVDVFESMLISHPNQPLVTSVCRGLREGFWPWANTHLPNYPSQCDFSRPTPTDSAKADFLRSQVLEEIDKGRFSESFGTELLPGMYSSPVYAVPKPHSSNLRMVTDHSAGKFSLNSMIDHDKVTGCPLDNLHHLGHVLLTLRQLFRDRSLVLFKCDIAEAYRLMPMHPLWQLKQINTVDGLRYVDRNATFGSTASPKIFISFVSLVAWIAKNVEDIQGLSTYMDDFSGAEFEDSVEFYSKYNTFLPRKQVRLLSLWDKLGIPHAQPKQVSGSPLTIIGLSVDPNELTITLPEQSRTLLVDELHMWGRHTKSKKPSNSSFKLKKWQQLAGWVNWGLNAFPLLRPCLNNLYFKMRGHTEQRNSIYINDTIRSDLLWAAQWIEQSTGVHLLSSTVWNASDADFIVYCDASLSGLGFWIPSSCAGFHSSIPYNVPPSLIFYFEALCVVSALQHCADIATVPSKILIYTDNFNSVNIFSSLKCLPDYNPILKLAVDTLLHGLHNLRVLHVPGDQNQVADALSRANFPKALQCAPGLSIHPFQPPLLQLGAVKK